MASSAPPPDDSDALIAEEEPGDPGDTVHVEDVDPEAPDEELPFVYSITSYGADYTVDGLVARMKKGDIEVPDFQRQFIWPRPRIDRFIESLLLGLPVPGIFLALEPRTNKQLVIDGQQRLRTLQTFYDRVLRGKEFALGDGVQDQFKGHTYETLEEEDRRRLDNSIIHATVVRQDEPSEDQSSIYFVFERLNTGGTVLQPQEIRAAIYQGKLNALLAELNEYEAWRNVFGRRSPRLKDQELILRFFAFLFDGGNYSRPMKEFLNESMGANRNLERIPRDELESRFYATIDLLASAVSPSDLFRPKAGINAAVFDAVTVAVARRLDRGPKPDSHAVGDAYVRLLRDPEFITAYSRATADEASVERRLRLATEVFDSV